MKKIKETLKNSKAFKTILAVIALLAALMTISGINLPHLSPFSTCVALNYPNAMARTKTHGAVIDTQGKRLLITDGQGKVTAVVETERSGSPVDKMYGLTIFGDTLYVFGSQQFSKGIYLSAEKVVTYDLSGTFLETIFERTYKKNDYISMPRFQNILADDEGIWLTLAQDRTLTVKNVNAGAKTLAAVDFPEQAAVGYFVKASDRLFVIGKSRNCYAADIKTKAVTQTTYPEICQRIAAAYREGETVQTIINSYEDASDNLVFSNSGEETEIPDALSFSVGLFVKNLLYWISVAMLAVTLIVFLIWYILKKMSVKVRIAMLIIGGILLTSVFYTWNVAEKLREVNSENMTVQARQMALAVSELFGTTLTSVEESGIQAYCADLSHQEKLTEMADFLCAFCHKQGVEKPLTAQIIMKDDTKGAYYSVAGSDLFLFGEKIAFSDELRQHLESRRDDAFRISNYYETFICATEPVYDDDGHFLWAISTVSYEGNVRYTFTKQAVDLFISLAAVFIALYISFSAFKTFGQDIRRMRKRDKSESVARRVDMAGVLTFVNGLVFFIDSVIVVYVVKSLCADYPPALQATLIALPISLQSAGNFLGNVLYTPLRRKFGDRTLGVSSALITVSAMLMMAFAVGISNLYLYFIGKLLFGFFDGGLFYILVDTIPYMAEDERTQKEAINSVLQSSIAAEILSCLTGGYIAEYLSYGAIYILGAVIAGLCLIMAFIVFRNKKRSDTPEELSEKPKLREYWKIFLKRPMFMYIVFYVFPWVLLDGYSTYLFPLYTASAGISALLLSNISVFGKALVYAANDALVELSKKMKPQRAIVLPMLLICAGMICFILSPNIYWAVAMLFVFLLLDRMPQIGRRMYMSETALAYGLEAETVQSNYYTIETGLYTIQPTVLSAFVNLGMNLACTAVGIFCGCCFGIFARFLGKKQPLREQNDGEGS